MACSEGMPSHNGGSSNRDIEVNKICPCRGEAKESITHMDVMCGESHLLWRISPLRGDVEPVEENQRMTMMDWCAIMIERCKLKKSLELVMVLIWQVWNMHNLWVHEKKRTDPMLACRKVLNLMGGV